MIRSDERYKYQAYVTGIIGIYKYKDSKKTEILTKFIDKKVFTQDDMKTIDTMVDAELRITGEIRTERISVSRYSEMIKILMKTEIENGMIMKINRLLSENKGILIYYNKLIDIKFLAMIASLREKVDNDDGKILSSVENIIWNNVSKIEFKSLLKQLEDIMSNLETQEKHNRYKEADNHLKVQGKYMTLYNDLLEYYSDDESKIQQLKNLQRLRNGYPTENNKLFSSKDMGIIDKLNQEKNRLKSKIRSPWKSPTPSIPVLKKSVKLSPKIKTPSKQTMGFLTFFDSPKNTKH
jgi:hypothetical protein